MVFANIMLIFFCLSHDKLWFLGREKMMPLRIKKQIKQIAKISNTILWQEVETIF
jgi:hypothetical protein